MDVTSYLLGKKAGGGGGSEPTGTIDITSNGVKNVKSYASANVNVQPDLETKSVTITENTTTTITPTSGKDGISSVAITTNVPTGITPTGTINITQNGTHDVTNYASANVNVSGGQTLTISSGTSSKAGYILTFENIPSLDITGTSCKNMFYNYTGSTIPVLNGTSNVTTMENMFYGCINVTNFNFDNYDTSNVTNMRTMFYSSSAVAIRNLDCSSFNVQKVTDMAGTFQGLYQLAKLDISSFDFSGVTTFNNMFANCGTYSKQVDGAYADGIPYVYVKDAAAQNWVLTASNGHPNTWSTNNVIIKNS